MNITYFAPTKSGCDYYRGIIPLGAMEKYGGCKTTIRTPQNIAMDMDHNPEKLGRDMSADIVVLPRNASTRFLSTVRETMMAMNPNGKLITDFDDNVFKTSPLSDHYSDTGTEEYSIQFENGERKMIWRDGVNIDIKANKKKINAIKQTLSDVDLVTTTTTELSDAFKPYTKNLEILPNCVDLNLWEKANIQKKEKDEIRLYWSGKSSHYEDWYQLKGVLPKIMEKYPNVKLVILGWAWENTLKGIPMERIEWHRDVPFEAYPYKTILCHADISLIPLRDTEFNRCKSAIKWIEQASLEIPSVTTYIPPYKQMADHDQESGIFIERNDAQAWFDGISLLIENEKLRKTMGKRAKEVVKKHYDINTQYKKWVNAYEKVLKKEAA